MEPRIAARAMTAERLVEFSEAWNTGDIELILSYFSDDGTYHASFGPDLLGRTFVGHDALRHGLQRFLDRYPDGRFVDSEMFVAGDRGAAEWTFVATEPDGSTFRVRGCDLYEFDGDLIRTKNAFRKQLEQ